MSQKIRLLVVQEQFRFYRVPLLSRISEERDIDLTVVHGTNPPNRGEAGLNIANGPMLFRVVKGRIPAVTWQDRQALWFGLALRLVRSEPFDVVVHDYFCRFLSIWPMQSFQRRHNRGFILWGIGFHLPPTWFTDRMRLWMVSRSDAVILYGPREHKRYVSMGVPESKLFVAQNTIDIEGVEAGISAATKLKQRSIRERVGNFEGPILLHVGRLAKAKRLDLLVESLPFLRKRWPYVKLLLIGDGPERKVLAALAQKLGVAEAIYFAGSITDTVELAPWVLASDLVVAPAQIGLQAPMAHAYGKALVVSDDPLASVSGPEYRAFVPGKTGLTYRHLDRDDLVRAISELLANPDKLAKMGRSAFRYVREDMPTDWQTTGFLDAIRSVARRHSAAEYHASGQTDSMP